MGRFWGSSQAAAYGASILLGGLFHACSLNPQPAPPVEERLPDASGASGSGTGTSTSSSAATSTTGEQSVDPTSNGTTGGSQDSNGDGVIDADDTPTPESPGVGTTGTDSGFGGGAIMDGSAGAAGAATEPPPEPANGPR